MENLNAEAIKKALECCRYGGRCAECPCFEIPNCQALANENALALINSQEQRIKELTESYNSLEAHYIKVRDEGLAENKRLTEENERLRDTAYRLECEVHRERADTLLEYSEKVYQLILGFVGEKLSEQDKDYITVRLGQIAKEMLEGEK